MYEGDSIGSVNKLYYSKLRSDGNLATYRKSDGKEIWKSGTAVTCDKRPCFLKIQVNLGPFQLY